MFELKIVFFLAVSFSCCCFLTVAAPDSLRLVNVLYRHGDRSPVNPPYPTDIHKIDVWPQGLGWLSQTGMRQQYALGQFLRREYGGNFLNDTYKNSEIRVEASNVNRCLMSAYSNLAGLYPPSGWQVWNSNIPWQPIPVHTRPEEEDNKLAMGAACKRYDVLFAQELKSPEVQEEERVNHMFYQMMDKETGMKHENISEIWKIIDTLVCEKAHNYSLPRWTQDPWGNSTVWTKLMWLRDWSFALLYKGTQLSRLKGGPLLKEFIGNMMNYTKNPSAPYYKMYMYSAHDSTVAAVTDAMTVYNQLAPPYATAVLVELHQNDDNYCVQIRYRNETDHDPYPLVQPGCGGQVCCPLATFVEATKERVPVDWDAECQNVQRDASPPSAPATVAGTTIAFVALLAVCLLLLTVLLFAYIKQRRIVKTFQSFP